MNTKTDHGREKAVFKQAIGLASLEDRRRFLERVCVDDPDLLARVRGRLGALEEARGVHEEHPKGQRPGTQALVQPLAQPSNSPGSVVPLPGEPVEVSAEVPGTEKEGDRLGRYKLLEKIGEGGCGTVYLAEQLEPVRRRVALKVVKLGMDTREVIARFEAERQALAVMDHPNIAKVLDAGATDSGRPYFVMELVRGVRITHFCDERQLCVKERLELFIQVCRAIQHAHQKGIIHRDIKPSNILVTRNDPDSSGVPKVIDFGIAKATQGTLTDKTLFTMFEQFMGTPAYMSPEQAEVRGVDIDTRSDIYSLGVVLYELLTGRTPFDSKALLQRGIEELILTLREAEPLRPSARLSTLAPVELETVARSQRCDTPRLVRGLQGDLDWIVMKCLEKDRSRRYDTANMLAMDIQRHLAHEPVLARPPTVAYRFHKALRRHKLAFATASLVALTGAVGVGAVLLVQHRANQNYRQRFHAYQMGRAGAAVAAGQFDHLAQALAQCPPEQRHWEWRYLNSQVGRWSQRTVFKLDQPVRKLQVSRDGALVVLQTGDETGAIQIRRFPSGEKLSTIQAPTSMWLPLALHPDGSMLAGIPTQDRQVVHLWSTRTGDLLKTFSRQQPVECLAFSPDGRLLAAGGGVSKVSCWDLATGAALQPDLQISNATALVFAPDGRSVGVGTRDGSIHLLRLASGQSLSHLSGGQGHVSALVFSPDGGKLVSHHTQPALQRGILKLWDLADGSSRDLGMADGGNLQFSPDGGWIMNGGATFWDSASGELLGKLRLDELNYGLATCFHPNGGILSAGPGDAVVLATANRPAFDRLLGHQASLRVVRFSPNGQTVASAGLEREIRLWDVATGRPRTPYAGHSEPVAALAWSPDGQSVVSASFDHELQCWDSSTLQPRWTNSMHTIGATPAWWLESSPDGKRILSSSENGVLGLWDALTGASLSRIKATNSLGFMDGAAWSPDGKSIAGLFKDRLVLWRVEGWHERWRVPVDADRCVQFSRDGRWLALGNRDGSISLRDAGDGRLVRSFDRHQAPVKGVALSPDGRRLFSGGEDGAVRVWDIQTGDELLQLNVTGRRLVWSIDFSRDGRTLAAADSDGVVTLWKTE